MMKADHPGSAADLDLRELIGTLLINQSMINSQVLQLLSYLAEGREVGLKELKILAEIMQSGTASLVDVIGLQATRIAQGFA